MRFQGRRGEAIADLDAWRTYGGPASEHHWVDGRSSKCLAEAWLGDGGVKLATLIAGAAGGRLSGFSPELGIVEAQTRFDRFTGGPRNHDLLVIGECEGGRTVVGVEGKADETFGGTVAEHLEAVDRRLARGERTNAGARLDGLLAALDRIGNGPEAVAGLRYQLFTGVAGTLAAAAEYGGEQAVFCVQEFVTNLTDGAKQDANVEDLRRFVASILGIEAAAGDDWIAGPINVPGSELVPSSIPLWVCHMRISHLATPA